MIELIAVPCNNGNEFTYFKKCCGNCKYAEHLKNKNNMFKCIHIKRVNRYPAMYNNIRILSQTPCRYFDFVDNYEYNPDARLHNKNESNIKVQYDYSKSTLKIEKAADIELKGVFMGDLQSIQIGEHTIQCDETLAAILRKNPLAVDVYSDGKHRECIYDPIRVIMNDKTVDAEAEILVINEKIVTRITFRPDGSLNIKRTDIGQEYDEFGRKVE